MIRFIHALPNSWLPTTDNHLILTGISAADLIKKCEGQEIISHIRYVSHCAQISLELKIDLQPSGELCPSPFCNDYCRYILAILSPGETEIKYLEAWDGTLPLSESGIWI